MPGTRERQRRNRGEERARRQRQAGAGECAGEHCKDESEHRGSADGRRGDMRDARAGGRSRALAARRRGLQIGHLDGLERGLVGRAQRMSEHALRELLAAGRLALRAGALDRQLIALALVPRACQRGLADDRRVLHERALALAELRRSPRRLELGPGVGELSPALLELAAQAFEPLCGLRADAHGERLGDELLGLVAQALELLPGAQSRRVAIVQVAASFELRLAAPGARQLAAHARELGGRLVVGLGPRQRLAPRGAQLREPRRQLRRARLAASIGAPERVCAARELLGRDRRRAQEGRRGSAQQPLLDLAPGARVEPAQLVGIERVERKVGAALEPGDLGQRPVGELLLGLATPGAARRPRAQVALDAHARAVGQGEFELAVGVAVERGGRVVLARGGREAVEHRGHERAQARLARLVRAVDDDQIVLGEPFELELGERAERADADAVDLHGAASARSDSASVSSSSLSKPAR